MVSFKCQEMIKGYKVHSNIIFIINGSLLSIIIFFFNYGNNGSLLGLQVSQKIPKQVINRVISKLR